MATKLYLHRTEFAVNGLTAEQSSLAPDANLFDNEDGTENRLMDKKISTVAQTTLTNSSTADVNAHNYYIARWVSEQLNQTSVAANTWTLEFGATENNAAANFPRSGAGALRVNCYVWKPSNGTKYGTILDGNTNADGEEAGTSQTVINCTFSGASVASLTAGDARIVLELWAIVTQANGTSRTQTVAYDGTTEGSTTNMAARLETPENLVFAYAIALPTETVVVSDSVGRLAAKNRSLDTETVAVADSVARLSAKNRALDTETVIVGETLNRLAAKTRALDTETVVIGETLDRLAAKNRALDAETVAVADNVTAVVGAGGNNVERTLEETVVVSDSVSRLAEKTRTIQEDVIVGDSVTRLAEKTRTLSDSLPISDSVDRLKAANRSVPTETVVVSDSVSRLAAKTRELIESVSIGESVVRQCDKIRSLATETVAIADNVVREVGNGANNVARTLVETVDVSDSVARQCNKIRTVVETVSISDLVQFVNSNTPAEIIRTFSGAGSGGRRLKRLFKRRNFKLKRYNFKL